MRRRRPLGHAQDREHGKVRRCCQQRGRDRQDYEADQDPLPAVDPPAEQRHSQASDCHAHRAGIDRKSHCGRRHPVGSRERWQNCLSGEQVYHRKEGRQPDHDRAEQRA